MAADGESTGKSKGQTSRRNGVNINESSKKDGRLDVNGLETIPTVVPREGDGYPLVRSGSVGQGLGRIGELGFALTEDDLQRINTRKGFIQLLDHKAVDIEEVRRTLLYEQELRQLQVELVRLQRWVQSDGERIAILVEGRDAAGKGGTIRRFTEHLNPRAMRVVALPKPSDEERGQWYFQRYIRQLPNKGEIVFFDRSWYNRAVVEPVMGFCSKKEHQRFLQQVPEFEHMLYEDGVTIIKFWFSISKEEQAKRFEARRQNPLKQWKLSPMDLESRRRWERYTKAKETMIERTHIPEARWWVVEAVDKKRARLNCISHLLSQIPYREIEHEPVALPERVHNPEYIRGPLPKDIYVPAIY